MNRRNFLKTTAGCTLALAAVNIAGVALGQSKATDSGLVALRNRRYK
jgi:hypothetical protein